MSDLRTTYRQLWRAPAHVATVVVSLGIGMAVCGAVFSAVQAWLFAAVPGVVERTDLVRIRWADSGSLTAAEFDGLAASATDRFDGLAAQGERIVPIVLPSEAVSGRAAFVSGAFFRTLGTTALHGRLLRRDDDRPGAAPVAVLGEALWRRSFASDPDVIGRPLVVDGRSMEIVGVAPRAFDGLALDLSHGSEDVPELWLPLGPEPPHRQWLSVAARLRPGQAPRDAQAVLDVLANRLERVSPSSHRPPAIQVFRAGLDWYRSPRDAILTIGLFLFVPLALLGIGCANVVNLQLARAAERTRELSVRLTLGASRLRLLRLLVLEVGLLGLGAAALGTVGAGVLLKQASGLAGMPLPLDPSLAALFAILVVGVIAIAGLAPGWMASRDLVAAGLRVGPGALGLMRLRGALVVFQITVSVTLLYMAAIGVQTLRAMGTTLPPDAATVLVAEVDLGSGPRATPAEARRFLDVALASLDASDAVHAAGAATFFRHGHAPMRYWLPANPPDVIRVTSAGLVTPRWFEATGTRLLAGRRLAAGDLSGMVVSGSLAAALGGGTAVLGRTVDVSLAGGPRRPLVVVGVAEDAAKAAPPMAYLPMAADAPPFLVLTARTGAAAAGREAMRAAIQSANPAVPRDRIASLERKVGDASRGFEAFIDLASAVAGLSLLLATAGLFALLSFSVRRRYREIGVRVAVGATRRDVVSMVLRQALLLAAAGCACGLVVAVGVSHVMRATLAGVSPVAATAMVPTVALLLLVTLIASLSPTWRAVRIEPSVVLRDE